MDRQWLPAQLAFTAVSAAVIVAGFVRTVVESPIEERSSFDANFLLGLLLCLLPAAIYLLGVRTRSMVIIFGVCLSVPTVVAWLSLSFDAPLGVLVLIAVPFTFLTSVIGTVIDRCLP